MDNRNYLIILILWILPAILLQWLIGLDVLIKRWKVWVLGILVPTAWLIFADSVGLGGQTWVVNPAQSLGVLLPILNVPLEEALFYLLTNTLIVQSFIFAMYFQLLFTRVGRYARLIRRGPPGLRRNPPPVEQADQTGRMPPGMC